MRRFVNVIFASLAGLLTILTFSGFLGSHHWFLDITASFRIQYTVGLLLLVPAGLVVLQRRIHVVWLLPALLVNALLLGPFFLPLARAADPPAAPLRVLTSNILAHNQTPQAVIEYLQVADADIILLAEIQPDMLAQVTQALSAQYPYLHDAAQRGTFGIALFSRYPLLTAQTHRLGINRHPSIQATIAWQDHVVTVYGAHPFPPLGADGTLRRDSEIAAIQALIAQETGPLILMGDLNATPWSASMRQLISTTDLRYAAHGYGIRPTWPAGGYGSLLVGVPLDHVLVSSEWQVTAYRLGPDVGSDHYPVLADLVLP
jgi:endonuclease/exonuclease/phosphatase (EEP) superfamily protein YafD